VRLYLPDHTARYVAIGVSLLAYSYIGLLVLAKLALPTFAGKITGSSAGGYSLLSHSWFRDFLYEPHAVTALSLLLAIMTLSRAHALRQSSAAGCLIGVGFGSMIVTDTFIGIVGLFY